ncbi:Nif3-like dinuclear metal center hexameric protein [Pontibacter sp. JAM-7]|uniref:Nif3-like dinuclear metal center hexameric protein n=1 Tax=Pontibacter sp. JAM-7 TaxID=3366581 RepID=UPI003AF83015
MATKLNEIIQHLEQLLQPDMYADYCPNGLQVEGCSDVRKIVTGVTASQALIDAAIAADADMLLVHHGFFWKGESSCITGIKRRRIRALLQHDISLVAYHLPLDAHSELGNNVQLAQRLGVKVTGPLEPGSARSIGLVGELTNPVEPEVFCRTVAAVLHRSPQLITGGGHLIKTVGWCTGAAQGYIDKAIALGLDAFLSGEISEPTVHSARENGIHYIAAGHHATERYGVQALGEALAQTFEVEHQFIEIENPV